ncbi:carboxypeptidase D [Malassezia nana]|uniref:Carboxypeptidase n=1 Tax=Malassezia nana TaxID=180528 RepID=A0AAF0END4_9BASI|nr:carboxypeptidase D [Malassezia nana]
MSASPPPGWVSAVVGLPGLERGDDAPFDMDAGYMPVRELDQQLGTPKDFAHVYFWRHRAMYPQPRRKLVLWLNGGPGCSSLDGALMELGAFRFKQGGSLKRVARGIAWNEYADVVYVDQPVGTGFSIVDNDAYAQSLQQVADEFVMFLRGLSQRYPEYTNDTDVYLAGESYAGQYIPYIAKTLLETPNAPFALSGIMIGNGFIDPRTQYGTSVETLQQAGVWQAQGPELSHMAPFVQQCHEVMQRDARVRAEYAECEAVDVEIQRVSYTQTPSGEQRCINMFDLRLNDSAPACGMNWPPEVHAMGAYLKRSDVRLALHVDSRLQPEAWVECNSRIGHTIRAAARSEEASVHFLPMILEHGVRVLLYAGEQDLVCPALGYQRLVNALTWHGATGLGAHARPAPYLLNAAQVGTWIEGRNVTLALFHNASHMAPYDAPYATHDMMLRFIDAERTWPAGYVPSVYTRIGSSEAWLVAAPGSKDAAPGREDGAAASHTSRAWLLVVLVALAVGYVLRRRRSRRPASGGYHAVGQHIVDE